MFSFKTKPTEMIPSKAGGARKPLGDLTNASHFDGGNDNVKKAGQSMAPAPQTRMIPDTDRGYMQRNVDDIDERDAGNPMLVTEYVNEMYEHYKNVEREFMINPNYMAEQGAVNEKMRAILVDWLVSFIIVSQLILTVSFSYVLRMKFT